MSLSMKTNLGFGATHTMGYICTILTMGLYNTYLLAVYYRIHEYSKDYLCYSVYSNGLGLAIEQIPILNIFTYIKIMKRLRKAYPEQTWKFMWKLYFQARLTSYLINNDIHIHKMHNDGKSFAFLRKQANKVRARKFGETKRLI